LSEITIRDDWYKLINYPTRDTHVAVLRMLTSDRPFSVLVLTECKNYK